MYENGILGSLPIHLLFPVYEQHSAAQIMIQSVYVEKRMLSEFDCTCMPLYACMCEVYSCYINGRVHCSWVHFIRERFQSHSLLISSELYGRCNLINKWDLEFGALNCLLNVFIYVNYWGISNRVNSFGQHNAFGSLSATLYHIVVHTFVKK